jgi:UDP-N-acetylglucosamine transferase subunit ALG13
VSTFVSVGNAHQSFARLLNEIDIIAADLPQPVVIQHGHTPFESKTCVAKPFVGMAEFEEFIVNASLVILHAGGGGVLQAVQAGKVPVIVPRRFRYGEHVDDHQVENAKELALSGKVIVAEEPGQLMPAVKQAMELQREERLFVAPSRMLGLVDDVLASYARQLS